MCTCSKNLGTLRVHVQGKCSVADSRLAISRPSNINGIITLVREYDECWEKVNSTMFE